jgi:myo-inositol-1(or 4)-monophosphatase
MRATPLQRDARRATGEIEVDALGEYLAAAIDAARAGGAVVRDGATNRASLAIERKKSNDFVSIVDKGSERAIIALLSERFPGHAFFGEETGRSANAASSDHVWIIDPLDGTTNFLHGIPHYCVSIALSIRGAIAVGTILDPIHDRLFTATRSGGAWLNGERIAVSDRPSLSESVIGTGLPFSDWSYLDAYLGSLREIMQRCAGIRRAGACALDLAYVAAGWLDGFWERNVWPWDVAAGSLMIEEAGGAITDMAGGAQHVMAGHVVCGGPGVHRELLEIVRRYPALSAPRPVAP